MNKITHDQYSVVYINLITEFAFKVISNKRKIMLLPYFNMVYHSFFVFHSKRASKFSFHPLLRY